MTPDRRHSLHDMLRLTRMGINILVGAATLAGYYLKTGRWSVEAGAVTLGCILLASGCSVLNQVQEREPDRRMHRTRRRPIAAGTLSPRAGLWISLALFLAAGLVLAIPGQPRLYILLGLTILLYNGIYTPLKRITPFALLAGAIMGAFPPLFGWMAAGGSPLEREILILMVVFWLWQTPHFWLLVDRYRADYRRAGFPQVFQQMPASRYRLLILLWVLAYFVSILLLPLFLPMHPMTRGIFALMPILFGGTAIAGRATPARLFTLINASILTVMLLLVLDKALRG